MGESEGMILTEVDDSPSDLILSAVPKPGEEINDDVDAKFFQGCRVPRVR
jgi:hypothetical protein